MRQLGLDQHPRGGSDYPLVQPVSNHLAALADLQVLYDSQVHVGPFSLVLANGFGSQSIGSGPHAADLVVVDRTGQIVVDTRVADEFNSRAWGSSYTVFRWRNGSSWTVAIRDDLAALGKPWMTTGPYQLDSRTTRPQLPQLQRLEFYKGNATTPDAVIEQGSLVRLRSGYNLDVSYTPGPDRSNSGDRIVSEVGLSVTPGGGIGAFSDCSESSAQSRYIQSLAGVTPDGAGNVSLSADLCFRIEPVMTKNPDGTVTIVPGQLMLADDCVACCDCEDFQSVYQAMLRLRRRFQIVAKKLTSIQDMYHDAREKLIARRECNNAIVSLKVAQTGDCVVSAGLSACNTAGVNAPNTRIRLIAVRINENGDEIATGSFASWSYHAVHYQADKADGIGRIYGDQWAADGNSAETLYVDLGCVPRNDTRSASFVLRFLEAGRYRICAEIVQGINPSPGDVATTCREVDVICDYPFYYNTTTTSTTTTP